MKSFCLLPVLLLTACASGGGLERLRADPTAYRAVGTDPAWTLSVDRRVLIFEGGGTRLSEVVGTFDERGGSRRFRSASASVSSTAESCSLAGDGARYPETVVATVNGQPYRGCGGPPLAAGALAGSSWRVLSVKGRALPAGAANDFRFEPDRFSARFGCNNLGAPYALSGVVMSVGPVVGTRMACPDMTAETDASAILTGIVTVNWVSANRLTLSNANGLIVLER